MILVTGGYGCIGAELIKWLIQNTNEDILLGSRKISQDRTQRIFPGVDTQRLSFVELDVADRNCVDRVLSDYDVTRIAHLGALQTPDCNAHRDFGLQVNLAGTQHLIEASKAQANPLQRVVFASSIAVYGPRVSYPGGMVPMLAEPNPVNVYGVWKLASEQICRFYCQDTGVPTISLRPGVLYGPGRDIGLTSTPTTAMKCVALNMPYEIPFCNRQDYLYAPDVGAAFGNALMEPFDGYGVFTLPSHTVEMDEVVASMQRAAESLELGDQFHITHGQDEVPFICDLEHEAFAKTFPQTPHTPLESGLRESLQVYRSQVERGWLTSANIG